jgi:hypothetical protein
MVVTLIVIQRLGAIANAHYYIPAMISYSIYVFLLSVYKSFIVEAASEPHALRHHTNMAIAAMGVVLVPSVLIGVIFAPLILRVFGTTYVTHSTTLLRMLLLSLPMGAVSTFYSAFAWLDRRVWWMALRDFVTAIIYFSIIFIFIGHYGILSIGIATLVSSALQGIFFLPIAIRRYRLTTNYELSRDDVMPATRVVEQFKIQRQYSGTANLFNPGGSDMEFLRNRTDAIDASIRGYHKVKREYLNAYDGSVSDERAEDVRQRLRAAAQDLVDSAERLVARIDGDS